MLGSCLRVQRERESWGICHCETCIPVVLFFSTSSACILLLNVHIGNPSLCFSYVSVCSASRHVYVYITRVWRMSTYIYACMHVDVWGEGCLISAGNSEYTPYSLRLPAGIARLRLLYLMLLAARPPPSFGALPKCPLQLIIVFPAQPNGIHNHYV